MAHYSEDPHVRLFRRFLNKDYDLEDLKFYLAVVMLSRDGIPNKFLRCDCGPFAFLLPCT